MSVLGAVIGGISSNKAAKAQTNAANQQAALARETRDLTREDLAPFLGAGTGALNALQFELGLGPRPTFGGQSVEEVQVANPAYQNALSSQASQFQNADGDDKDQFRFGLGATAPAGVPQYNTSYRVGDQSFDNRADADAFAATTGSEYGGYTKTPGYDFRLQEGVNAIDMSAASRGGLHSGATLKASQQYGQDYATSEYGNYLNRLTGMASNGQNAAGAQAASNQFYSQQAGNAIASAGNAQAAGAIGMGNALQGGLTNIAGNIGYQRSQHTGNTPFQPNWGNALFGF